MNDNYQIVHASIDDLDEVMKIYDQGRKFMRINGNKKQWINGYPQEEVIKEDIALKRSYLIKKNATILAVFTFINGEDETYHYIEGQWLNDEPYGVIHRIASNGLEGNMLHLCLEYCFTRVNNIRIDTHEDNLVMQNLLIKEGFTKCGIIYLKDGQPRFAYQKIIK